MLARCLTRTAAKAGLARSVGTAASPSDTDRPYTPRRALMYVPGHDERKLAKIPAMGADCVCLDCEDGVAASMKEAARTRIRKLLDEGDVDFGRSECSVRVNPVSTDLGLEDVAVVLGGKRLPHAVHLPKVEGPECIEKFSRAFHDAVDMKAVEEMRSQNGKAVGVIIFVESANALMRLHETCQAALTLNPLMLVPEALVFGSDDFVADIGATRTADASELLYARQKIVVAAKAHRMQVGSIVFVRQEEGCKCELKFYLCVHYTFFITFAINHQQLNEK